jgi:hypothetical protein
LGLKVSLDPRPQWLSPEDGFIQASDRPAAQPAAETDQDQQAH